MDRDSNQVEGHFSYMTPEGRELETRYALIRDGPNMGRIWHVG